MKTLDIIAGSGDDPMDVDSLVKGKDLGKIEGKSKVDVKQSTSKGKDPSNPKFDGTRHNFGEHGTQQVII